MKEAVGFEFLRYFFLIVIGFSFLTLISCEDDSLSVESVITEDLIFVGSEEAIFSGRIIAVGDKGVINHGFQVSESNTFNDFLVISIGNRALPGKFIGQIEGLKIGQQYYVRSFIDIGESIITGNELEFETFEPEVFDFNPKFGKAGDLIVISGKNFPSEIKVFFDDQEVAINSREAIDSRITIRAPVPTNVQSTIRIFFDGNDLVFDEPFEYVSGIWSQSGSFIDGIFLRNPIYILSGNTVIYGLGTIGPNKDGRLWSSQIGIWNWEELDFGGTSVRDPFFGANFFGGGFINSQFSVDINSNQFWTYSDSEFIRLNDAPFFLQKAIGFKIDDNFYVLGGINSQRQKNFNIYRYSISSPGWQIIGTSPLSLNNDVTTFTFNNSQYFILENRQIWKFNVIQNDWVQVGIYPGPTSLNGAAVVEGNRVFIGLFEGRRVLWEFDLIQLTWKIKENFPGDISGLNSGAFEHSGKLYFIRNSFLDSMTIWEFSPDEI